MKQIPLTQGQFALVDDEDFEELSKHSWQIQKLKNGKFGYAIRTEFMPKKHTVYMHCAIMGMHKIDHADTMRLNNQRYNLRVASPRENAQNRPKRINSSSQYKGVAYRKDSKQYRAYIQDGKLIHLGQFGKDEIAAAKAYDKEALQRFGKFANLNFPIDQPIGSEESHGN